MLYQLSYASLVERETGIGPATNSLEGCDSTTELLPRPIHYIKKTDGELNEVRRGTLRIFRRALLAGNGELKFAAAR